MSGKPRRRTAAELLVDNRSFIEYKRRNVSQDATKKELDTNHLICSEIISDEESSCSDCENGDIAEDNDQIDEEVVEEDVVKEQWNGKTTNSLVDLKAIRNMVLAKCICRDCVIAGRGNGHLSIHEMTFGLATTVYLTCRSCPIESRTVRAVPQVQSEAQPLVESKSSKPPLFGEYMANINAVLLMQNLGVGLEGLRSVLAHLGLSHSVGNYLKWKNLQERIGQLQEELANECVEQNRIMEVEAAAAMNYHKQVDDKGVLRQGIVVTQDAGWTKRSSGKSYSSPNGHYFQLGGFTKKIVGYNCYSKLCRTCGYYEKRRSGDANFTIDPPAHRCGRNFVGSSKSMEAAAAVRLTIDLYEKSTPENGINKAVPPCFVHTTVMDDDSTTVANLQHSLQLQLDETNKERKINGQSELKRYETDWWPYSTNDKGNKKYKEDTGRLRPSMLCPVSFLADPSHRTKILKNHLFAEYNKKGSQIERGIVDRLGRNFGYGLRQGVRQPYDNFYQLLRSGFDHEFDIHTACGEWCKVKSLEEGHEKRKKYWKKDDFPNEYRRLSDVYESFLTEERLKQMYHTFSTQKNESMNKVVTVTAPKNMVFCQTKQFADRVAWVTSVDSWGGQEALLRLHQKQNMPPPWPELTAFYEFRDKRKRYWSKRRMNKEVKKKRKAEQKTKWAREYVEEKRAKTMGQTYGTGIGIDATTKPMNEGGSPVSNGNVTCSKCKERGHRDGRSSLCSMRKQKT